MGAFLLLVAIATSAACAKKDDRSEKLIRQYNDSLVIAYRTGDASPLSKVAVDDEVRKVAALIDLKKAQDLVLEAELLDLAVKSTNEIGPDGLIVETQETWAYRDRPIKPGNPPGTRFVARMSMRYELVRQGEQWKVELVRTLENEFLEPPGYRLDGHQEHGTPETKTSGGEGS